MHGSGYFGLMNLAVSVHRLFFILGLARLTVLGRKKQVSILVGPQEDEEWRPYVYVRLGVVCVGRASDRFCRHFYLFQANCCLSSVLSRENCISAWWMLASTTTK